MKEGGKNGVSAQARELEEWTKTKPTTEKSKNTEEKKNYMRNEEEKLRFNTFIYATLAIHWTLCHRYLVFRGWFNSRILSIVHRLHVDSVFFSLSRLVTLNKNECA